MALTSAPPQEHRKFARSASPARFEINLLRPRGAIAANTVNVSAGGLCLRLEEPLEVRSLVQLQLTPGRLPAVKGQRFLECKGRVAWVVQRLDLRAIPPFAFDVGIEFVDPPSMLRHLIARRGNRLATLQERPRREKMLEPALIRNRYFVPRLKREANPALHWHLIVSVEGTPCFSGHYATGRAAIAAWATFQREQAKMRRVG